MTLLEIVNEHFDKNGIKNPVRYLADKLQVSDPTVYRMLRHGNAGIGNSGGRLRLQDADWLIKITDEIRTNPNGNNKVKTFLNEQKRKAGIK